MSPPLYLAFADGAIDYDCAPCGKCCRGLGLGDDLVHLGKSPEVARIAPFIASSRMEGPLVMFYTYADGCRYQGDDNLCDIHREQGSQAKPKLCRLYPFSKMIDLDGLWVLLPQHSCPWTGRGDAPSELSNHASVMADVDGAFLDAAQPEWLGAITQIPSERRKQLEEQVRDSLDIDAPPETAVGIMARAHAEHHGPITPLPPLVLWLDMLRSAGTPPPLTRKSQRTLVAAMPALRIYLASRLPLEAVPAGIAAFQLWLRTLAELDRRDLAGDDILGLFGQAEPLLHLLAMAEAPLPPLKDSPSEVAPDLEAIWPDLLAREGKPLGESVLAAAKPYEQGALTMMMQLGRGLPHLLR